MRILVAAIFLMMSGFLAHAEKRVALVIGNSGYKLISPLSNPQNDAALMVSTLRDVGFEVVTAINVDYRDMKKAVRRFGKVLRTAGKDAVGLLYYAGHGVQARGQNYLIPLNAQIDTAADLDIEAISASNILSQMEDAGNRLNLVVLDACRNNPYKGTVRSAGRGLARIQAASGSLIAFAAAPGQVAADGSGRNSPFTTALANAIRQPGLAVEHVFKRVRVDVERETGGAQTPWEESSLKGDFYFVPGAVAPSVSAARVDSKVLELSFWDAVKNGGNAAAFEEFLKQFPNGTFSGLAKIRLDEIRKAQSVELATLSISDTQSVAPAPQSAEEMLARGRDHETGEKGTQDFSQAAHWYRQAATKGHADAKYRLGLLYYHGRGIDRSWSDAAIQILDAVAAKHDGAASALTEGDTLRDPAFVRAIQQRLKTRGLYKSRVDGKWGGGTRSAVIALSRGLTGQAPTKSTVRRSETSKAKRARKVERSAQRSKKTESEKAPRWSFCRADGGDANPEICSP